MSFVMIATGAASRSRVRTLSLRHLAAFAAAAAVVLLGAGAGLGYWVGQAGAPQATASAEPQRPRAALSFAMDQLGALSGRLFKLESQAAQLRQRLGLQPAAAPRAAQPAPAMDGASAPAATGGPLLPPRLPTASQQLLHDHLGALEDQLARIEAQIAELNDATTQHTLVQMRLPTRLPVDNDGVLASGFGNREDPFTGRLAFHAGLDFPAPKGTPAHAAAGGRVVFAGFRPDYGWVVDIDHGNGLMTRYAHNSRLLVKVGQVVTPGQQISQVGSTGRSTGPHLHFEVLRNGEHVNPRRYLAGL